MWDGAIHIEMARRQKELWRPAPVSDTSSLAKVKEAARHCKACPLYKAATQTVFGEGPKRAPMMLIGEQPGDQEDLAGKPFVGPAGKIMPWRIIAPGQPRKKAFGFR